MFKNTILLILIISTITFLSISIKNDLTTPIKVQPIFNQNDCIRPLKGMDLEVWEETSSKYYGIIIYKVLMVGKKKYLVEATILGEPFFGIHNKRRFVGDEIQIYNQTRYEKVNCETGE